MRHLVTIVALCSLAATGCGQSHEPGGDDDAGRPDARLPSDAATDTGSADAEPDVTDPCAFAGCGAPPDCGTGCTAMCGCCGCSPGTGSCTADGTAMRVCSDDGTCYERIECEEGSRCERTEEGPRCVSSTDSCAAIEDKYAGLTAMRSCTVPDDCHVLYEHCSVGLGGCYGAVNDSVTQEDLNALADEWTASDCHLDRGVCDCPAPPPDGDVSCEAGQCTAG